MTPKQLECKKITFMDDYTIEELPETDFDTQLNSPACKKTKFSTTPSKSVLSEKNIPQTRPKTASKSLRFEELGT